MAASTRARSLAARTAWVFLQTQGDLPQPVHSPFSRRALFFRYAGDSAIASQKYSRGKLHVDVSRRSRKLASVIRPICLTLATSSDSMTCKIKPWLSKMGSCFYRDKQGIKGLAAPFPRTPNPRRSSSTSLRTTTDTNTLLDEAEHYLG